MFGNRNFHFSVFAQHFLFKYIYISNLRIELEVEPKRINKINTYRENTSFSQGCIENESNDKKSDQKKVYVAKVDHHKSI